MFFCGPRFYGLLTYRFLMISFLFSCPLFSFFLSSLFFSFLLSSSFFFLSHLSINNQRPEAELKDCVSERKVQKADREKLRRDRLNEQFMELGNVLDPDRPRNDKASILADTIQIVKDLTAQVNRLKAEYATLTEESRELTQEKNDLREEKASLKADIENLNVQYQQRHRAMFPWVGMDHSVVMHPPSYPFPVPVPIPPGPIPMHPSLQPYPFFANQNPGVVPNTCSTFVPYLAPNTLIERSSTQYVSPVVQPGSRSHNSSKQDSRNQSSDHQGESKIGKSDNSNDVATDLELKTPGSTEDQNSSSGQGKSKKLLRDDNCPTNTSSSSRCSSSCSVRDSSSNSVVGGTRADD
ncbi:hypothetical protein F0562_020474 [Nyssa sinensis]|uniref:BHLH domain-containing protein n=1 Tax=Nyssa sinensis TaxID=561372 RepID=A0A5J5BSX0_9ASTE|nr:hypothetical protein F0562_020474 [Nyssa sinensis]